MVSTKFYLDRRSSGDKEAPLKIAITRHGRTAYLNTGHKLLPEHWDAEHQTVIKHPSRNSLNTILMELMVEIRNRLTKMALSGECIGMTSTQIKNRLVESMSGIKPMLFKEYYLSVMESKKKDSTKMIYISNINRVAAFCSENGMDIEKMSLNALTKNWVLKLDEWLLSKYAGNTRNSTLASLRMVADMAVDEGRLPSNPFSVATSKYYATRKRDLVVEDLRKVLSFKGRDERERIIIDLLKFSFLTRATNLADIWSMTPESVFNGRIEYDRHKTGKHYSIKIEPELMEIIERRKSDESLFDTRSKSPNGCQVLLNKKLKDICKVLKVQPISFYWIRHSFASIAMELEIPVDIISAMLGHTVGAKVTMGYVDIKSRQVDQAARKVYDYVLYEK